MKLFFVTLIAFLLSSPLYAQSIEDPHYSLLDKAYKNLSSKTQAEYLITEFENFLFIYPNSPQEDEILLRLSSLYAKNDDAQQLKNLIKLNILHGKSPLLKRSSELIDSLITFVPELILTDQKEKAFHQLNNIPFQENYRQAYINYLSFLYSLDLDKMHTMVFDEIDQYIKLFLTENRDMDAVLFWKAQIYKKRKNISAAILNYNKVCNLYEQSEFVPQAMLELALINKDHLKNFDKARDDLFELINQFPEADITGNAQFELAKLYGNHYKDQEEALTNYKLLVSAFPNNKNYFSALIKMAHIQEQQGLYKESINSFMKIVEDNGDNNSNSIALKNIIRLFLTKLNDQGLAAKTMILFAQTFPNSKETPQKLLSAANIYLNKLKENNRAKEVFNEIIVNYPQSKEAKEAESLLKKL